MQGGGRPWTPPPGAPSVDIQEKGPTDPMSTMEWHNMVHKDIAKVVNPLRTLLQTKKADGGSISVTKVLELAGKTITGDLPKCTVSGAGKKKGLCWNFLTGRCRRGKGCKHVHARPSDLPDKLVSQFAQAIAPGVAKAVEDLQVAQSEKHAKTGKKGARGGITINLA